MTKTLNINKKIVVTAILLVSILASLLIIQANAAANDSANDIVYPVRALGNCQNESECRNYCDDSQRAKECFAFAKKYNLISEKDFEQAEKKFFDVKKGPGGCNSGTLCEAYCNNVDRLDECIAFAEESGYYSDDKLAEAKKVRELLKNGKKFPGGCKDRNQCERYCSEPQHMEECLNFAEESGFMPKEEIEQARKILPLMQRGETPGGCASKEQCEKYCFEDNHSDECIVFGEKVGLISSEDAAIIKKTGGRGPGGCRSKEQCEAYCKNNGSECFQWAQDNGLVNEADLIKMKKGVSQFKEQLDKIPPEVAQCLKDAVGEKNFNTLVSGEPIFDRSMEGKMKSCFNQLTAQVSKQFNTLPPEATECIKDVVGEEGLKKFQSGEFDDDIDFGSLEGCFQQLHSSFGDQETGGPGGPRGHEGFAGPGGCKSIDECSAYCQDNPDECQKFAPPKGENGGDGEFPGGGSPDGQFPGGGATSGQFPSGPGGCRSQEECVAYCKNHPEECKNFGPPSEGGNEGLHAPLPAGPDVKIYHQKGDPDRPLLPSSDPQPPQESSQEQYQKQFQIQYQQEYQKQFNEQQETRPPEGLFVPLPAESYTPPPSGSYPPPPTEYHPPEGSFPPPSSSFRPQTMRQFLGGVIYFFLGPF